MAEPVNYSQKLRVKTIDIIAGKLIAILNEEQAKDLGVLPLERVELTNPRNGKIVNAVVDITDSLAKENEIVIFKDVHKALGVKEGAIIEADRKTKKRKIYQKENGRNKITARRIKADSQRYCN